MKNSAAKPISCSVVIFCLLSAVQMIHDSSIPLLLALWCSKHRAVRNSGIASDR